MIFRFIGIFTFCFFVNFTAFTHDYYMAIFDWHQTKNRNYIKISLDKKDIFEVFLAENPTLKNDFSEEQIIEYLKKYLTQNLKIWINNKPKAYNFTQFQLQNKYIRLLIDVPITKKIKQIKIKNTCLISHFENQQNIHKFYLFDTQKSFQLHQNQTEITVKYD